MFTELTVRYPKFTGTGFVAFPTLRGAYKEFVIEMEFRPDDMTSPRDSGSRLMLFGAENPDGVIDFFSVAMTSEGHIEFRSDDVLRF